MLEAELPDANKSHGIIKIKIIIIENLNNLNNLFIISPTKS